VILVFVRFSKSNVEARIMVGFRIEVFVMECSNKQTLLVFLTQCSEAIDQIG
jgi:hypothetical protein